MTEGPDSRATPSIAWPWGHGCRKTLWCSPVRLGSCEAHDRHKRLKSPMNPSRPNSHSRPIWEDPRSNGSHLCRGSPAAQRGLRAHASAPSGPSAAPASSPPAPEDAEAPPRAGVRTHLLLQLVVVALPGQLVLVLGPLGRGEQPKPSSAREAGGRPETNTWAQTGLGARASGSRPPAHRHGLPSHSAQSDPGVPAHVPRTPYVLDGTTGDPDSPWDHGTPP